MHPQSKVKVLSTAESAVEGRQLRMPNPGDIMLAQVFGVALLCFFVVTIGDRLLLTMVRLFKNPIYKQLLLESVEVLGLVMVAGSLYLVAFSAFANKYQKAFLALLLYSLVFANAGWKPLHDVTWIIKYSCFVYLIAFTAFFVYRNFWRLVSASYVRVLVVYVICLALISIFVGGRTADYWLTTTEVVFFIGFSVAWFYNFNNQYGLYEFNKIVAWTAVAITLTNISSIFLTNEYMVGGRFVSYYGRATAFGVIAGPVTLAMFWMAMCHKDAKLRVFFWGAAVAGLFLILLSGSRSPTAATIMGIGILWLLFRSTTMLVMLFFAGLGIAIQVIFALSADVDAGALIERLQNTENERLTVWVDYFQVALQSPIYGYSPSGTRAALDGVLGSYFLSVGLEVGIGAGIHNSYLGVLLRFGFVGLGLFLSIIVLSMVMARRVLLASAIPKFEKETYIANAAILPSVAFMIFFEDFVPGSGKGTYLSAVFYGSLVICQVYGATLINKYVLPERGGREIKTLEGVKTLSDFEKVT